MADRGLVAESRVAPVAAPRAARRSADALRILRQPPDLRQLRRSTRERGERIALVPTMGALHEGHLALVRSGRELADRVVVSIFVNPTQFGPNEDFARYPRQPDADAAMLAGAGCDVLFLPAVETIYPPGHATFVEPGGAALGLEGDLRPGHFRGVATVVTQLFGLVEPDLAIFGQKDAQQLAVVRQLVRDLHLPVEIASHPTIREVDGLALSSRNRYLSAEDRAAAAVLHCALLAGREAIGGGERHAGVIRQVMRAALEREPRATCQYAEVVEATSFRPFADDALVSGSIVLPIAATLGATRLIDNLPLVLADAAANAAPAITTPSHRF